MHVYFITTDKDKLYIIVDKNVSKLYYLITITLLLIVNCLLSLLFEFELSILTTFLSSAWAFSSSLNTSSSVSADVVSL